MNRIGDIQPRTQDYRSKISANESELTYQLLNDYEQLLQLFKQKNETINRVWDFHENEKYQLAQEILDPLEQILYSSLLGIRTLDEEIQSDSAKSYLASLKCEMEKQLKQLKEASLSIYPICMQDLGAYGAIKSYYELLKQNHTLTIHIEFKGMLKRQSLKIERKLYRLLQHLIQMIDTLPAVSSLTMTIYEQEGQIVATLESEALIERLKPSAEYQFFKEVADSLENIEIVEQDASTFHLLLQKS